MTGDADKRRFEADRPAIEDAGGERKARKNGEKWGKTENTRCNYKGELDIVLEVVVRKWGRGRGATPDAKATAV